MVTDQLQALARGNLPLYFLIAYIVSWLFWVPLALSQLELIRMEVPGLFLLLGGLGPIAAGTFLTWHALGWTGLRETLLGAPHLAGPLGLVSRCVVLALSHRSDRADD